jgi:uncharacterized protein (TIGR04255 family)
MADAIRLPHFEQPPVSRVVLGIVFMPLSRLRATHIGLFWNELNRNEAFPEIEEFPYRKPVIEKLAPSTDSSTATDSMRLSVVGRQQVPRIVLSSTDHARQVAVQRDLLQVSWYRSGNVSYPRYEALRSFFLETMRTFEKFASEYKLGRIRVRQAGISYTNSLTLTTDSDLDVPQSLLNFQLVQLGDAPPTDHFHTLQQHTLVDDDEPYARLSVGVDYYRDESEQQGRGEPRQANLTISVDGPADSGSVMRLLDRGHDVIINSFLSATTPQAHEIWGRLGGAEDR